MCKLILDEPVSLPCDCWICKSHLTDTFTLDNQIKCLTCKETFTIPPEGFRTVKQIKHLLEQELILSDEEKQLKIEVQNELKGLKNNLNQLEMAKQNLKTACRENFGKIREKVESHATNLKLQIEKAKEELLSELDREEAIFEEISSNSLEENQSEQVLKEIANEFRNPFFNIDKLNELKSWQFDISSKVKLKCMKLIKTLSNDLNEIHFKPNLNPDINLLGHLEFSPQIQTNNTLTIKSEPTESTQAQFISDSEPNFIRTSSK